MEIYKRQTLVDEKPHLRVFFVEELFMHLPSAEGFEELQTLRALLRV